MINSVLKSMKLNDIDAFLSNTEMEISGAGRYFHIKDKEGKDGGLVSADTLAARIDKLAKEAGADKQIIDNIVKNFIDKDAKGYTILDAKMENATWLGKVALKVSRFFKTGFSKSRDERINERKTMLLKLKADTTTKNDPFTEEGFKEFLRMPAEERVRILSERMKVSSEPKTVTTAQNDPDPFTEAGFKEFLKMPDEERVRILSEKMKVSAESKKSSL